MGEIETRISPAPYTIYIDYRYSSGLYAEYIGNILSNLIKIVWKF